MQALHTASVEMEQEGNTNQLCDLTASLMTQDWVYLFHLLPEYLNKKQFFLPYSWS